MYAQRRLKKYREAPKAFPDEKLSPSRQLNFRFKELFVRYMFSIRSTTVECLFDNC